MSTITAAKSPPVLIHNIPWYFHHYAKMCFMYVKTTGKNTCIFPKSLYLKESNSIPVKVYISKFISVKGSLKDMYFVHGKYYTPMDEDAMHEDCINFMKSLNWELVAHEWTVIENNNDIGKGDLVFQKDNSYFVIECKRRTNSKVYEQSRFYGSSWKLHYAKGNDKPVLYGIWTPRKQEVLGILYSEKEALNLCDRRIRKYKNNIYVNDSVAPM
jgi:hypothetical protein